MRLNKVFHTLLQVGLALALGAGGAMAQMPHSQGVHLSEGNQQNYVRANELADRLDEAGQNHRAKAMADANVALTQTESIETRFLELTGANTAVRTVTLYSTAPCPCDKNITVWNNTTGGFDVTVGYSTGATVNVSPGQIAILQGDGTDIMLAGTIDIAQLSAEGTCDDANDKFLFWDDSADSYKAITCGNLPGGGGGGGGVGLAGFDGALVLNNGPQSIANQSSPCTKVDWDGTETEDTRDFHSPSTNPSRFTIPAGVNKVEIVTNIVFDGDASPSGQRSVIFTKNGATVNAAYQGQCIWSPNNNNAEGTTCHSGPIDVGAGDYLEVCATQTSGAALDVEGSTEFNRVWAALRVIDPIGVNRPTDNQLVNGDFQICQRGCSFTGVADDTYTVDRFINLVEGANGADHAQETTTVPGAPDATTALKITAATANDKFGILQVLPADRSNRIIGATASLSFQAQSPTANPIANIRATVACWTGTADSVTSDIVSAWGAAGTNPTPATSWTFETTPANLAVTADAYGVIKVENIAVDTSGCNNVGVFIWVDEDSAIGDILYLTDIQLEPSVLASAYQRQDFEDVLSECQRHYYKSYDYATAPGTATAVGAIHGATPLSSTNLSNVESSFPRAMFGVPTVTWYSPSTGTSARVRNRTAGADVTISSTLDTGRNNSGIPVASSAVASGQRIAAHLVAVSEM